MRILILILCLVALAGCEQRTVDVSLLQTRSDGLIYLPNESEPYSGLVTQARSQIGISRGEFEVSDGKLTGVERMWNESGQLAWEENYVDGRANGLTRAWHGNGQLASEAPYSDGKQNGLHRAWHENGELSLEVSYVDGKRDGLDRAWDSKGQLLYERNYANGEIVPKP